MSKPLLYDTVNTLYHGVMDRMPQCVQERDLASAFVLGTAGSATVVKGLQLASEHIVDRAIPGFDGNVIPMLEQICIAVMLAAPLVYSVVSPNSAKETTQKHPTYSWGWFGIWLGSVGTALYDLSQR